MAILHHGSRFRQRQEIDRLFTTDAQLKVSPPSQSEQRMTITWSALSSASHIHLLGKGQEKMDRTSFMLRER